MAVKVGERGAAPLEIRGHGLRIGADVHDGAVIFLNFADLAQGDVIREAAEVVAGSDEVPIGGVGGTREQDEHRDGEEQDARGDEGGDGGEAGGDAESRGCGAGRFAKAAADFGAGGSGDGADEIDGEVGEEVEIDREHGGGDEFDERDGGGVKVIAVGARGEDLHDREEADQVDGGFEEAAGEEEIVGGEEGDVGEGDQVDGERGEFKGDEASDSGGAKGETEADEDDGGGIEEAGTRDGEEASGDQAQEGELEEALDGFLHGYAVNGGFVVSVRCVACGLATEAAQAPGFHLGRGVT